MCGGGGYSPPPDNSLQIEQMRQAAADRERERLAAEKAANEAAFSKRLEETVGSARARGTEYVTSRGLDPNQYSSVIERAISGARGSVPQLDSNPMQYFGDNIFEQALNSERDAARTRYQNEVRSEFAPGFERSIWSDTADDSIIDSILGTQRREAEDSITRAMARGQLTDVGRQQAANRIGELFTSGRSAANTLGQSVIDRNRTTLRGIGDRAVEGASGYELGGQFSLDPYRTDRDSTLSNLQGSFEGDIRGALSGQKFFDIGEIMNSAGVSQGAQNPRTDLAGALGRRNQLRDNQRGVGGQGEF